MAPYAPGLTIGHVVPLAALADWHDVVGVHLTPMGHTPTVHTLPSATVEDSLTPPFVCLVAIASSCCVGPSALVPSYCRARPPRLMARDARWHQLFSDTTATVPVLFVVAETIFKNDRPYTSSGSE